MIALLGSLLLAAVFGAGRATTVRIGMQDGQPWIPGGFVTAALWVLALAAHLGYDYVVRVRVGNEADGGLPMALVPSAPFLLM